MLHKITHGTHSDRPPLLIAHGLYGSHRNWGVIGKRLSNERQVIAVDMRNHGASPQLPSHTYDDLADDLAEVISQTGGPVDIVGHSMGGKAAMVLALKRPELLHKLIVADIAPVRYEGVDLAPIAAMKAVDLERVSKRSEAAAQMGDLPPDLKALFLQSLDLQSRRWKLNLDVLERDMTLIRGFPEMTGSFGSPTLFLTGATSDYVLAEHRARIKDLFPGARFAKIPGAGHFLQADKPREVEAAIRVFLNHK